MKDIYVFGDSHVNVFTGLDVHLNEYKKWDRWHVGMWFPGVRFLVRRFGPNTAFKAHTKTEMIEHIRRKIPKHSTVILSFGEIDTRRHLARFKNPEEAAMNYFKFIDKLNKYKIVLYLPPPQGTDPRFEGSFEERQELAERFREVCKIECGKRGVNFIDIHDKIVNENGRILKQYLFDDMHLNKNVLPYLEIELKKII